MRDAGKTLNRVRILREDAGMGGAGLAEKPGMKRRTLGYGGREECNVSLATAFRIAGVFGTPLDIMFSDRPMRIIADLLREGAGCGHNGGAT